MHSLGVMTYSTVALHFLNDKRIVGAQPRRLWSKASYIYVFNKDPVIAGTEE